MIDVVFLVHGHRIDLGPKHDHRTFFTTFEDCRQPGASEIGHQITRLMGLDEIPNDAAGLDLLASELGVSMELPSQGRQPRYVFRSFHRPQCTPPGQVLTRRPVQFDEGG